MKHKTVSQTVANVSMLLAGFALSLYCPNRAAASTFTYDFEGMTNGPLATRDGWNVYQTHWTNGMVTNGPAGSVNTTKVLKGQGSTNAAGVFRLLPQPVLLGASNPTAVVKYHAYGADASAYGAAGPMINGNWLPVTGLAVSNGQLRTFLRQATGTQYFGDVLMTQNWYEVKVVMDFSTNTTPRGTGTLSYRNLTTGQSAFTPDSTLTNFPLFATTHTLGYWVDSFFCRLSTSSNYPGAYIDNFSFEATEFLGRYTAASDSFDDGGRNNGNDALDMAWVGTNITLTVANDPVIGTGNALKLTNGIKDPCIIIGYTYWSAILDSKVGDKVRFSCDLRFNTIITNGSPQIRIGLYKRANFDGLTDTNIRATYNDSGYVLGLGVYTNRVTYINAEPPSGTNNNALCGGNGVYSLPSVAGSGATTFAGFNNTNSKHTVVMEVVRWTGGVNGQIRIYAYVDDVLVSVRYHDEPLVRAFDEVAIFLAANASNLYHDFTVDNVVLVSIRPRGTMVSFK